MLRLISTLRTWLAASSSRKSRTFPATREALQDATAYLDRLLESGGCPPAVQSALDIVLDEIASNIVAYSGATGFTLEVAFVPDGVRLVFSDDGTPYDPLTHEDPDTTLSAEARAIGGLGILMVKKMTDSATYRRARNRNVLTLFKRFPPKAVEG